MWLHRYYKEIKREKSLAKKLSANIIIESKLVAAQQILNMNHKYNFNFLVAIFLKDKINFNRGASVYFTLIYLKYYQFNISL